MEKQRVLLLCTPSLLGESLELILSQDRGIEVIGPWQPDERVAEQLAEIKPDVVLLAQEDSHDHSTAPLTSQILEQHPDIPIICVGLADNVLRVYTSSALPARSHELLNAIRRLPRHGWVRSIPA